MKISVITVVYNSASTISDTIKSVVRQNHTDFEHIIIDAQSSDDTLRIIKDLNHSRLTVISEPDHGIYDAMNKGLKLATGEVVGFLNSDDFYADTLSLENIAKAFHDKSVGVFFSDLVYVTQDKSRVARYWRSKQFAKGNFAKGWTPAHPTFYVRRSYLSKCGFFDLTFNLAADADFMMRYLERYAIKSIYIPRVLVCMRLGGVTNHSWSNIARQNIEVLLALKKNNISYSAIIFCIYKIMNRVTQYFYALIH